MAATGVKIVAKNQKAYHEYFIEEKFETGIELSGTEVKSIRLGNLSLKEAWCQIKDGELFIRQMHIAPYEQGNIFNRDPLREKKLLLHKAEIRKLQAQVMRDGYTLIPLSVYFSKNRAKLEVGVCKGKKLYDKRAAAKAKDDAREMERAFRERQK